MKHSITSSSKGDDFECKVFLYLKNELKIDCQRVRLSRGDGGIDIFSNYQHYLLLFQCKDLSTENGYSSSAKARAESSDCHLLLTNFQGLCQNISDFLSEVFKDNSLREMIYRIEKKVDEMNEKLNKQEKIIHKIKNNQIKIENKQIMFERNQTIVQEKIIFYNHIL
ncbi:hypothetical protein C2G38_2191427 [Gigaspora rosea]|uniref:Restriction endonuclease type IV Mrr domain-containing protein n=1 Tax=Gigaspora rosea TaxID=44941 RepID=A0A397V2R9_9GLOM|nr:hypothetical protein C2G38_2191427 [Gigaspora rosea]